MKRKNLPLIIMLVAGALTSILTFLKGYELQEKLLMLLITLIVFYGLGCLLAGTLNHFDKVNQERKQEEEKAEKIREQESEEKEEQK